MENPNDKQVAGQHYRASYQHWDLIFDLSQSFTYFQGCATKYAARWRKKYAGDPEKQIEDLEKVVHYVEKMIWLLQNEPNVPVNSLLNARDDQLDNFASENDLSCDDHLMLERILFFQGVADLKLAKAMAEALADGCRRAAPRAATPAPAPAPDPSPARFTRHAAKLGAAIAGARARHSAPTAPRPGEIGTVVREMGAGIEIRYGSLSTTGQADYLTVDKHYVEILEQSDGMEHPFGYDAQQEG